MALPTHCPNCNISFDGGDIYEKISKTFPEKSHDELIEYCSHYGWMPENKKNFSNIIHVKELGYGGYWQCPECEWNDRKEQNL